MVRLVIILFISLLPVLVYCFLYHKAKKRAELLEIDVPPFFSEKLLKVFIQFLAIMTILFVMFIIASLYQDSPGQYVPARVVDGKIEKGRVEKR